VTGRILSDFKVRTFLYQDGELFPLPTLITGGTFSASDINERTEIVGQANGGDGALHPVIYKNGKVIDLGLPLGVAGAGARAVNDRGQIVVTTLEGVTSTFVYDKGTFYDTGSLGNSDTVGAKMNNRGQVVGLSRTSGGVLHAFVYDNGRMTDLGDLYGTGSNASGINDVGDVVGGATRSDFTPTAFIWSRGVMKDLNLLLVDSDGWHVTQASAINNAGEIVGSAVREGEQRAVLLQPIP